jgi:hypothetical protein
MGLVFLGCTRPLAAVLNPENSAMSGGAVAWYPPFPIRRRSSTHRSRCDASKR